MNALKKAKQHRFWPTIDKWGKRLIFLVALSGAVTGAWKGINALHNYVTQPFHDIDQLIDLHKVMLGIDMEQMDRIEWEHEYWTVMSDGIKRDVYLFQTTGGAWAFLTDDRYDFLPFKCFMNESLGYWYFFEFAEDPHTIIYEK